MLFQSALRPFASCSMHNVGLQASRTSIRTFASSPTSLLARRIPSQLPARATTAAIPLRRNPLLLTTFAVTSALTIPFLTAPTIHLDTSPVADFSSGYSHGKDAKVPLSKDGGRSLNPAAVKQISMGTILGLGIGVLVSAFSKMLVLLVGVGIVVTQYAARRGYSIIPAERMQRYVKGVNLRSAINDNAAFKISFGLMFALTAFGEF